MPYNARPIRALAACLTALAGFVDALGFLQLDGYYVSFMSGNSTRLSIGLANNREVATTAAALVVLFVVGVVLATAATRGAGMRRPERVLALVAGCLALAGTSALAGWPYAAVAWMTVAMGAENIAFARDGEAGTALTYMTGTLVKFGQQVVVACTGGDRWAWAWPLSSWIGLIAGAAAGTFAYRAWRLDAVWVAAVAACGLVVAARALITKRAEQSAA